MARAAFLCGCVLCSQRKASGRALLGRKKHRFKHRLRHLCPGSRHQVEMVAEGVGTCLHHSRGGREW